MITSIVLTLDSTNPSSLLEQLGTNDAVECGQQFGTKLPITVEAETPMELESHTQWLRGLPGILNVDVVFVDLRNQDEPADLENRLTQL